MQRYLSTQHSVCFCVIGQHRNDDGEVTCFAANCSAPVAAPLAKLAPSATLTNSLVLTLTLLVPRFLQQTRLGSSTGGPWHTQGMAPCDRHFGGGGGPVDQGGRQNLDPADFSLTSYASARRILDRPLLSKSYITHKDENGPLHVKQRPPLPDRRSQQRPVCRPVVPCWLSLNASPLCPPSTKIVCVSQWTHRMRLLLYLSLCDMTSVGGGRLGPHSHTALSSHPTSAWPRLEIVLQDLLQDSIL